MTHDDSRDSPPQEAGSSPSTRTLSPNMMRVVDVVRSVRQMPDRVVDWAETSEQGGALLGQARSGAGDFHARLWAMRQAVLDAHQQLRATVRAAAKANPEESAARALTYSFLTFCALSLRAKPSFMYNVSRIVIPYSVFFLLMPGTTIWTARALTASSRDTARSMRALLEAPAALVEEHPSKEAEAGPAHGSPLQMDLGAGLAAEDPAVDTAAVDASAAISALEAASDMGSVLASTTATSVTSSPIAEWIAARGGIEALFRAPNAHLRRLESRLQEWNVSSAAGASAARDQSK